MGTFTHRITLFSEAGDHQEDVDALVDTGATFSSAPATLLSRLGVQPERTVRLQLANGEVAERPLGFVKAQIDGVQSYSPFVFARPEDPSVIGAVTLEIFLLAVDPVKKQLVPATGLWV